MRLSTQTFGTGTDMVLLHGWGLHSGIWQPVMDALQQRWRVTLIDLPGHGQSHAQTWDASLTEQLVDVAPDKAIWLGWSIGGMLALQTALQYPGQVAALIMVATNPCLTTRSDWPRAISPAVLAQFAADLDSDYARTLQRFLALQVTGSDSAQHALRQLRAIFTRSLPPSRQALQAGLEFLQHTDLRQPLTTLAVPACWIGGGHDTLVPEGVMPALLEILPELHTHLISGAGHAPFLSHTHEFIATLKQFLHE